MNLLRATLILFFAALAVFCVGYAHSATTVPVPGVRTYSSGNWLTSNCEMRVELEGGTAYFTPGAGTQTRFAGFWPDVAGAEEIRPAAQNGDANESLTIQFAKVGGDLQPVSYSYTREQRHSAPLSCTRLALE